MSLSAGTRLGRYEILSPLGAGGMGEVYRARDRKLGRLVALKVLPSPVASDSERRRRFEREARVASVLNHPNAVTIHDVDEQDGTQYIAMELVEGKTLRECLGDGPLPTGDMLRIATQIAEGLAKAHSAGIVHRDLKPGNLMITDEGLVKVLDFGLAKQTAPSDGAASERTTAPQVTGAGMVMGTVPYMSPEQAAGRSVGFHADQFSFGSILYEMATGRRAFKKDTTPQTLAAIIEAQPEPVGKLNDRIPADLAALIARCLSKDPGERYQSTGDLVKELALCSASTSASASTPRPRRWLAIAALILLAAAASLHWQETRPEGPELSASPLVRVPLTTCPGREAEPGSVPSGGRFLLSTREQRTSDRMLVEKRR